MHAYLRQAPDLLFRRLRPLQHERLERAAAVVLAAQEQVDEETLCGFVGYAISTCSPFGVLPLLQGRLSGHTYIYPYAHIPTLGKTPAFVSWSFAQRRRGEGAEVGSGSFFFFTGFFALAAAPCFLPPPAAPFFLALAAAHAPGFVLVAAAVLPFPLDAVVVVVAAAAAAAVAAAACSGSRMRKRFRCSLVCNRVGQINGYCCHVYV